MAFFRKAAFLLGETANTHLSQEISPSRLFVFQVMRYMSSSKIFVGGLSYNTDDTSLRGAFDKYGEVHEARVIVDRETGRSRGFAFVTYSSTEEASAAIQALDERDLHGRRIRVNYANDRTRGYGGGGSYGGGYGGGYGDAVAGYGGGGSTNYNSGIGRFGNSAETNSYDGQSFGGGGSDNYFSGGADSGSGGYGPFGGGETNDMRNDDGLGQNQPPEADYRDDTPDNYADRRG